MDCFICVYVSLCPCVLGVFFFFLQDLEKKYSKCQWSLHMLTLKCWLLLSFAPSPLLSVSFCLPDKLFGKRLLQAGRHILSHKSWMKTVPTENCDVLMTFGGQATKEHQTDVTISKVCVFRAPNKKYKNSDNFLLQEKMTEWEILRLGFLCTAESGLHHL